jgi:hypothetical protein
MAPITLPQSNWSNFSWAHTRPESTSATAIENIVFMSFLSWKNVVLTNDQRVWQERRVWTPITLIAVGYRPSVYKLCTTTCHLLAFTSVFWHIIKGQTPQAADLLHIKDQSLLLKIRVSVVRSHINAFCAFE